MTRYILTLALESESDPREWLFEDTLIIDEPYKVTNIEEVGA